MKDERELNESLNIVAVGQSLEEMHSPCNVILQSRLREMRMAGEFGAL